MEEFDMPKIPRLLIGIAGPTAGGKTLVADHLERTCHAFRTRYSMELVRIAHEHHKPTDKASLQELSTELRRQYGEDFLTVLVRKRLEKIGKPIIVVEGNRRVVDMQFLAKFAREQERKLILIYIDANPEVRFARMNERLAAQRVNILSRVEFIALDMQECERELPEVKTYVHDHGYVVNNTSLSKDELVERVNAIVHACAH